MAVSYVSATSTKSASGGSATPTVPKPAGIADGDLLLASYVSRGATNFTPPAGWTSIAEADSTAPGDALSAVTLHVFYKFAAPGDPSSWSGSVSTTRAYGVGVVALRGVDPSDPIDAFATAIGTGTALAFSSVTVEDNGSMIVGAAATVSTGTEPPATTTERWDLGTAAGSVASGDGWTLAKNAGATGSYSGTATASSSGWATGLVAVRPAPDAPPSASFTVSALFAPVVAANFHTASASFAPTASLAADAKTIVAWALARFTARGIFTPTLRPRGKKRRTIIVDASGAPFGEVENARQGAITKELNRPDAWTFALGLSDPKAPLVLEQRIREAQLWRGDRLLSWGPMIRPGADKSSAAVSGADALWYLGRRNIGRAGRANYVPNGDFEEGLGGWDVSWSSPIEPASTRNPSAYTGQIRTDRAMTGRRSLYLEQFASSSPKYGMGAATYFLWEVDPDLSPDGDRWTVVAYAFVPSGSWRGPRHNSEGPGIYRFSTTEYVMIGAEDGSLPPIAYPAPIEGAGTQIDDYTPHDQWIRLEASLTMEPTGQPELVQIRLPAPDGAIYYDRVSLTLEESSRFYATDQALIVKGLVEHAQDPAYDKTDLNISTDTPLTGVLRDRIYVHSEHPNALDSILEFAELDNGVDVSVAVTPTDRILRTHYPARGVYRPKCRLELGTQIADFAWSFDGEAAANAVIVLGQGTGSGREEGFAINPDAFAGDLTLEAVFSAPPETPIDSLDNLAAEYAVAASDPEILAVKTFPNLEEIIGILEPGDWIPVRIRAGRNRQTGAYALVIAADYRVSRWTLNPDDTLDLVLNLREIPT